MNTFENREWTRTNIIPEYEQDSPADEFKLIACAKRYYLDGKEAWELVDSFLDCAMKERSEFNGNFTAVLMYLNWKYEGYFSFEGIGSEQNIMLMITQRRDNVIKPNSYGWRYVFDCLNSAAHELVVRKGEGDSFLERIAKRYGEAVESSGQDALDFFNECYENGLVDYRCYMESDSETGEKVYCFERDVYRADELAEERDKEV